MNNANCPSTQQTNEGQPEKTIPQSIAKTPSTVNQKNPRICPHCGFQFRLNVVADRKTGFKYLRAGCCDTALRKCPDPNQLLSSLCLTEDERDFLRRVATLDWFSGTVAGVLLGIEARLIALDDDSADEIMGNLLPTTEADQSVTQP